MELRLREKAEARWLYTFAEVAGYTIIWMVTEKAVTPLSGHEECLIFVNAKKAYGGSGN